MKELTFPDSSNDEIVQTAQKNDMSVEFVRWFFNEKKAACGEQWFLALGAMWEGWKAREGEATALALTLEKSREAAGCPAGVDLQDWVKQLAAESLAMKQAIDQHRCGFVVCPSCSLEISSSTDDVCYVLDATPAIDRIVAGIKADGVEEFVSNTVHKIFDESGAVSALAYLSLANSHVKQLREGADK
ncbi:hypothetical protein ACOL6E_002673 [Klebsiella aerogenes]